MAARQRAGQDLLVDPGWLAHHLGDTGTSLIEVGTPGEEFEAGHIPHARLCEDWHLKRSDEPALVIRPGEARDLFESLGIGDETAVVAYDRNRNRDASRLWWVLALYGHERVRVLDGGWRRWRREGGTVERGAGEGLPPGHRPRFTPSIASDVASTREALCAAIDDPHAAIWDIRSRQEYTGENDRGNRRRGHVPGARHLEWVKLVNEEDHTFKAPTEMRRLLQEIGVTPDKTVHVY